MSDHNGLRYLFDQPNMNDRQARWFAMISEFYFEIMYIKGKQNKVADALSRRIQVNNIAAMSSYGTNLQDQILQSGKQDGRYMELMHKLQKGTSDQDVDYCLKIYGLIRFRDKIYVPDNNELNKDILRHFNKNCIQVT